MELGIVIAVVSLGVSIFSLIFSYSQVRVAARTAKSGIAITLIDQLYSDATVRSLLQNIYDRNLSVRPKGDGSVEIVFSDGTSAVDVTANIDMLLNRFQIIGHLFSIGVLQAQDLQGLRYEILRIGRDEAVRAYLGFLASDHQILSGVQHDHFGYFKKLYGAFEYDRDELAATSRAATLKSNFISGLETNIQSEQESKRGAPNPKPTADGHSRR